MKINFPFWKLIIASQSQSQDKSENSFHFSAVKMVNAVMDAIALLSSLATDLDIMLNDLRSSPSTRLLPSSHHLPTRSASNGSSPLTVGGNVSNSSSNYENGNYFGYRRRVLCNSSSNNTQQQQITRVSASASSPTSTSSSTSITARPTETTSVKTTQCYRRGQNSNQNATKSATTPNITVPAESSNNSKGHQKITTQRLTNKSISANRNPQPVNNKTQAANQQRQQQLNRNRPDAQKLRARNANANTASNNSSNTANTSTNTNGNKAKNSSNRIPTSGKSNSNFNSNSNSKTFGLSPEVKQIQKLPLWSYQQRQLEQPQKVHVQRLQQCQPQRQRAMHSIIGAKATDASAADTKVKRSNSTARSMGCSKTMGVVESTTKTAVLVQLEQTVGQQKQQTNFNSISEYSDCKEDTFNWLNLTTNMFGSTEHSSSHQTSNSNLTLTSQNQSKTTSNIVTQHTTKTTTASTTISSTTSNNNSNSNGNNNNNNNNHRRLPFCGIDSIKGSDKNGGGSGGGGGTTNLSFDLNLQSEKHGNSGLGLNNGGGVAISSGGATVDFVASEQFHSLDADSSIDGQFEDDMQALLPKRQRDELSQSRTSLVSSSDGGILAEGETSSETSRGSDDSPPCDLGLVERLLLTHPVWFLPGIQRSGAVHFLQGKEEGNFIVRGSSQPNTMAVSVRLPPDTGPYIEHYLIQSNDGILSLESSRFKFDSIPALIAHYAQCCDELPVQLILPRALREAKNRQQLSSLALLGQEFWRYPMSCPKSSNDPESINILDPKSPNSLTETSGLGTTVFSSNAQMPAPQSSKIFSPTSNLREIGASIANNGVFSQAGTPSDTTSSMSSFTTSGGQHMQLMSPESVDSVILTMSPVDMNNQRNGNTALTSNAPTETSNLSTFKSVNGQAAVPFRGGANKQNLESSIRPQRPKPPNTLNLDLRKPPVPPLRWSKPVSPHSPTEMAANNFTVTTTVTFMMDQNQNSTPQFVEVTTPAANNNILTPAVNSNTTTFQTFSKRLSPEGECKDTLSSQGSSSNGSRWQSQSSKDSNNSQRKIISPSSMAGTPTSAGVAGHTHHGGKSRKSKARKESKHYQESDILESPQIYCRSTLIDKISDYEDLWSHDPSERAGLLTSFKPATQPSEFVQGKRPDLLAETPTITSLHGNLLSPANSNHDSSASPSNPQQTDVIAATPPTVAAPTVESTVDTHELIQFSGESQPRSRAGLLLPGVMSQSLSENQLKHLSSTGGETTEGDDTTPTALTPASRSKQGSPFYAEPADALKQAGLATASILRRSQRGPLLPANHRHSEPPKGGVARTHLCPLLVPTEIEKIAGSLDELKKKQQVQQHQHQQQQQQQQQQQKPQQQQASKRSRGRLEQWQLDSSWEFMGKQDDDRNDDEEDADYDSEAQWQSRQLNHDKENIIQKDQQQQQQQSQQTQKPKPVTVHQIIAKRLPDLNLPELVRCSTPPQQQTQQPLNGHKITNGDGHNSSHNSKFMDTCSRLSSYDNVERNYSICHSYFNGIDSAQSDDGTVFSEPWDSSQWDTFMPHDDATITSETIHLSKCRPVVSEDDTIIEELSTKDNSQDTLKAKKTNGRQKVATILRNPSMRDREILCHPRNKISPYSNYAGPGDSVRAYTLQLAQDQSSTFARNIENFISCTKESREAAPQVVMRNMRQFMNGMKNYLVKHGEGKFQQEVDAARGHLKSDEFLNLDAILETVMHQLVVLPLREHLYGMFVDYYTRSEDIQLLAQNVKYACGRNASDFGIRSTVTPPSLTSLTVISNLLLRLQEAELPLDKLDLFLCVISTIFDATGCPRGQQLGADDFLPILVYVVAKCGFVGAEIEAEFMWGLLQPTLLNGEPGYYLTALCSAVHVLKSFMASENESGSGSLDWRSSSLPACSSVLRVIIPDECNGSLQTRTLPVRPHTTTREVCRIIAHKARITNPQDYALFKLVDGEETLLSDIECPQDIRLSAKGKHCMLAYKRIDAKIAWPTATQPMHK